MFRNPFNWYNKFGTIPSTYREAMSYEEQILWLCEQIKNIKEGSANYNYNLLENKPSINGIVLQGNITTAQLGIDSNYNSLVNKPSINGTMLQGNKSLDEFGIQGKLVAGSGIRIVGNTISATGGGSGGTSDYNDLDNKPSIEGVTLEHDLTLRELDIQKRVEIPIPVENVGSIAVMSPYQQGSIVPQVIETATYEKASFIILDVNKGTFLDIYGKYDLYKISENNVLVLHDSSDGVDNGYIENTTNGRVVINFYDTDTYTLELKEILTGGGYAGTINNLEEKTKQNYDNIKSFLRNNFIYEILPSADYTNGYFTMSKLNEGSELLPFTSDSNYAFCKLALFEGEGLFKRKLNYNNVFKVKGKMLENSLWFFTKEVSNTEYIITASDLNIEYDNIEEVFIPIPEDADYLYFQFSNIDTLNYEVRFQNIHYISGGSSEAHITKLTSNLILLQNTTPALDTGFYDTSAYGVFLTSALDSFKVYGNNEIFYYDSESNIFTGAIKYITYTEEAGSYRWNQFMIDEIEQTLTEDRLKIPSSYAVYNAILQAGGNFYQTLDSATLTFNMDGTTTPSLSFGYYYVTTPSITYYYNDTARTWTFPINALCFYTGTSFIVTGTNMDITLLKSRLHYVNTLGWELVDELETDNIIRNDTGSTSALRTAITDTGYDNYVATIKAIRDYFLTVVSDTGTPSSSVSSSDDSTRFFKRGKLVIANTNFRVTTQINTNGVIYTSIPYLPTNNTRAVIISSTGTCYCINIKDDGTITIMDRALPTGWYNGTAVYFTND